MTSTSAVTFIDFFGNVLTVPSGSPTQACSSEQERGRHKAWPDAGVHDWAALEKNQKVSLWRRKSFVACGSVEEVMWDGSAVWLFIPKEFRRMLVHGTDGLTLSLTEER